MGDRQGVLFVLLRILEEIIDQPPVFLATDPRAGLLHHTQQDAKRLIYTAIQYFFPVHADRVAFLVDLIPRLTAHQRVPPSLLMRLWITLRYFINTPAAVAAVCCDASHAGHSHGQPTVLALTVTLLEALVATVRAPSSDPPPTHGS